MTHDHTDTKIQLEDIHQTTLYMDTGRCAYRCKVYIGVSLKENI
jgi:hypothetical protein